MIDTSYALGVMAVMAGVTFGLRALPFLPAKFLHKHPMVQQLGRFLPLAIMTPLLVHMLVGNARDNPMGRTGRGIGGAGAAMVAAPCPAKHSAGHRPVCTVA